jgi:hypothetical protein
VHSFSALFIIPLLVGCLLGGCNRKEFSLFERTGKQDIAEDSISSPIGDGINTEVYSFIKDYLLQHQETRDVHKLVQSEIEILQSGDSLKPHLANVAETEMSHLLNDLCDARQWCYQITIYSRDGVSIASSDYKNSIQFSANNIYEKIGFLYPNPKHLVRTESLNRETRGHDKSEESAKYVKIVRPIYYDKNGDYAYFLSKKADGDQRIGYISYIIRK